MEAAAPLYGGAVVQRLAFAADEGALRWEEVQDLPQIEADCLGLDGGRGHGHARAQEGRAPSDLAPQRRGGAGARVDPKGPGVRARASLHLQGEGLGITGGERE